MKVQTKSLKFNVVHVVMNQHSMGRQRRVDEGMGKSADTCPKME